VKQANDSLLSSDTVVPKKTNNTKNKTDCTNDEVWINGECKTLNELETACLAEDKIWENNS